MRTLIIIAVIFLLLVIVGPQAFFTVDETQVAIVTRFGEFKRSLTSPGIKVKTPFIDSVTKFDKRLLRYDLPPDSLLTSDKKNLIIDAYIRYRIVDPLIFFQSVRDVQSADARVGDIVASELRREIAQDLQSDIISESREDIMNRVRDASAIVAKDFGLLITDVRIKRADFPVDIAQSIFSRMEAERERIAKQFRAEGAEESAIIRADVDRQATVILAEAERDANVLRGEGEAEAISIFASALEKDPEFYAFQRSLQAYKLFLDQSTTVVLPADSELFKYLQDQLLPPAIPEETETSPESGQ